MRKKLIRGSLEVESNEGHVEDEILKAELSEVKKKCEDLIQIKEELNYDVEQKDNEYNHLEIFTNELSFKLEKQSWKSVNPSLNAMISPLNMKKM